MTPAYMHRLNAWQIAAFPERQKSNKRYKKSLLCFLYTSTCKLGGKGDTMSTLLYSCECVPIWAVRSKRLESKHQWCGLWLHPLQMEVEGARQSIKEGNREKKFWTNSPSHRQDWMTPLSCNTNQSQTCQLDSTCTFPACVPTQQDKPAV